MIFLKIPRTEQRLPQPYRSISFISLLNLLLLDRLGPISLHYQNLKSAHAKLSKIPKPTAVGHQRPHAAGTWAEGRVLTALPPGTKSLLLSGQTAWSSHHEQEEIPLKNSQVLLHCIMAGVLTVLLSLQQHFNEVKERSTSVSWMNESKMAMNKPIIIFF